MIEEHNDAPPARRDAPDIDEAVAELLRMPADRPERGPLAAGLIRSILRSDLSRGTAHARHLDQLLEVADGRVPQTSE